MTDNNNLDPEIVRALEAILLVAMEPVAPALLAQLLQAVFVARVDGDRDALRHEIVASVAGGHGHLVGFTA